MVHVRKGRQIAVAAVPTLVSALAVIADAKWLILLSIMLLFSCVAILPCFRHKENIGMFMLAAVASTPVNLAIVIDRAASFSQLPLIFQSAICILLCGALFSAEEIVLGAAARMLWKRQTFNPKALNDINPK